LAALERLQWFVLGSVLTVLWATATVTVAGVVTFRIASKHRHKLWLYRRGAISRLTDLQPPKSGQAPGNQLYSLFFFTNVLLLLTPVVLVGTFQMPAWLFVLSILALVPIRRYWQHAEAAVIAASPFECWPFNDPEIRLTGR
jgi:hypothetical protein